MKDSTKSVHAGYDKHISGTMSVPIYQSTAYSFNSAQHAANLFALKELGPIYTRLNNPTTNILEKRFVSIEGGSAGLSTSSGMSAIFYAIINIAKSGDNIIVSDKVYGGTESLTRDTIKRFGIEKRNFNANTVEDLECKINKNTKAILFEFVSNPQISVADVEKIVRIAKKYGILTIVDNTLTPLLFKPFDFDIDISIHSLSKYSSGQGSVIGGIIVERTGLNAFLKDNARYDEFNKPDESYNGIVYAQLPLPNFTLRARLSLARDIGAIPSPYNSWLTLQGLETLPLRITKHSQNANKLATFLKSHPKVKNVLCPSLEDSKDNALIKKYVKSGYSGGLISFEVDSFERAKNIIDKATLFTIAVNIGDTKSILTHPASTTHEQIPIDKQKRVGISQGLIRISVGIEDSNDLIDELKRILE